MKRWEKCIEFLGKLRKILKKKRWSKFDPVLANYIIALSCASSLAVLTLKVVFQTRVNGDNDSFVSQAQTCKCWYACENSSLVWWQKHVNVRASGKVMREYKYVNRDLQCITALDECTKIHQYERTPDHAVLEERWTHHFGVFLVTTAFLFLDRL